VPDASTTGSISVIDTASNTVTATIPMGYAPLMPALTSDGSKLFVSGLGDSTVVVVSTATNTVTATITAPGVFDVPYGIAIAHQAQQTPAQMVAGLIATVEGWTIRKKLDRSLVAQLSAVANDIAADNGLACSDLHAVMRHVKAQSGRSLTVAEADELLQEIASLKAALNCGP